MIQNNDFLLINNIIYQIYNIENFDDMKKIFLKRLNLLIPYKCCSILMSDKSDSDATLCDPICIPESFAETESLYLTLEKEDSTRWLILCNQTALIRESDLISEKDLINSNIYKKCYAPNDLFYSLQLHLCYNDSFLGVISLYRSKEDGNFTDNEMFIMRLFIDHLTSRFYNFNNISIPKVLTSPSVTSLAYKYNLTNRETEILTSILDNNSNDKIAAELYISSFTLKKHLQNIYKKFNVSSRWDLVKLCKT